MRPDAVGRAEGGAMSDYDWALWLGLALVLGLVEVTTLDLTFLMLAAGALAGAGAAGVGAPFLLQVAVAVVAAVGMLAVVRPVALRHLRTPPAIRTGTAALVGAEAVAIARVDAHGGQVKLKGEVWSARTYDPSAVIEAGRDVEVMEIDGATAIVYESER
jgi:membrane protein implicated in regulation of membrane protease activity